DGIAEVPVSFGAVRPFAGGLFDKSSKEEDKIETRGIVENITIIDRNGKEKIVGYTIYASEEGPALLRMKGGIWRVRGYGATYLSGSHVDNAWVFGNNAVMDGNGVIKPVDEVGVVLYRVKMNEKVASGEVDISCVLRDGKAVFEFVESRSEEISVNDDKVSATLTAKDGRQYKLALNKEGQLEVNKQGDKVEGIPITLRVHNVSVNGKPFSEADVSATLKYIGLLNSELLVEITVPDGYVFRNALGEHVIKLKTESKVSSYGLRVDVKTDKVENVQYEYIYADNKVAGEKKLAAIISGDTERYLSRQGDEITVEYENGEKRLIKKDKIIEVAPDGRGTEKSKEISKEGEVLKIDGIEVIFTRSIEIGGVFVREYVDKKSGSRIFYVLPDGKVAEPAYFNPLDKLGVNLQIGNWEPVLEKIYENYINNKSALGLIPDDQRFIYEAMEEIKNLGLEWTEFANVLETKFQAQFGDNEVLRRTLIASWGRDMHFRNFIPKRENMVGHCVRQHYIMADFFQYVGVDGLTMVYVFELKDKDGNFILDENDDLSNHVTLYDRITGRLVDVTFEPVYNDDAKIVFADGSSYNYGDIKDGLRGKEGVRPRAVFYQQIALFYFKANNYGKMKESTDIAYNEDPRAKGLDSFYHALGIHYSGKGKWDTVIECYERAANTYALGGEHLHIAANLASAAKWIERYKKDPNLRFDGSNKYYVLGGTEEIIVEDAIAPYVVSGFIKSLAKLAGGYGIDLVAGRLSTYLYDGKTGKKCTVLGSIVKKGPNGGDVTYSIVKKPNGDLAFYDKADKARLQVPENEVFQGQVIKIAGIKVALDIAGVKSFDNDTDKGYELSLNTPIAIPQEMLPEEVMPCEYDGKTKIDRRAKKLIFSIKYGFILVAKSRIKDGRKYEFKGSDDKSSGLDITVFVVKGETQIVKSADGTKTYLEGDVAVGVPLAYSAKEEDKCF
ncbi:MAG: hypothetical protein JSV34_06720, partial [Candidatus Omnitrophota bacterium]